MTIHIANFDHSFRPEIKNIVQFNMVVGDHRQTWTKDDNGTYKLVKTERVANEQ